MHKQAITGFWLINGGGTFVPVYCCGFDNLTQYHLGWLPVNYYNKKTWSILTVTAFVQVGGRGPSREGPILIWGVVLLE